MQQGGTTTATLVQPVDDDTDTSVTARSDRDGYEVRAPRISALHSVDSARNADLVGEDRMALDRFAVRSRRSGRNPTYAETDVVRLKFFSSRAGDAIAPRQILLHYTLSSKKARRTSDTTDRTDVDGYKLRVPAWELQHADDSALNSDLVTVGVTDRDRFKVRHRIPRSGQRGFIHRLKFVTDGRAGNAGSPMTMFLKYDLAGRRLLKAKAT